MTTNIFNKRVKLLVSQIEKVENQKPYVYGPVKKRRDTSTDLSMWKGKLWELMKKIP
mgnify:FL=1